MGGIISKIETDSIAYELGWEIGDEVVAINGHNLRDIIDFSFYSADEYITVTIKRGNETADFEIEKDYDMPLGIEFQDILFDGIRTCGANCIFCFVKQLPKGLRKPLYLKDDDYRLSFIDGNFVTLANCTSEDLERIAEQRLSPLYISVHTTNYDLRKKMLGRKAPNILSQIDFLNKNRITMHTQIVLCRGINDGAELEKSINDLSNRYPSVRSIAVVPAGLTQERQSQKNIKPIDKSYSAEIISIINRYQKIFKEKYDTRLVWAADEFYLSSGIKIPPSTHYEGYPQFENGVGIVRHFLNAQKSALKILPEKNQKKLSIIVITGILSAQIIRNFINSISIENCRIEVLPIKNKLFGSNVTVTGLITGKDILDVLKDKSFDAVFIPSVMLNSDSVFLDDLSLKTLQEETNNKIKIFEPEPKSFIKELLRILKK
ncbi:MAG: DUF512 domain-containing protein [Armatimonadota bacterium]